jgi:la-related protein 1
LQGLTFGNPGSPAPDGPAVFTRDGQQLPLSQPAQPGHYFQPYFEARAEALNDREHGVEGALEPMYSFWSTFLVKSFNQSMYNEFRELAVDDQSRGDEAGFQHLLSYYDSALKAQPPISTIVASDLVTLLRNETTPSRPVFKMLRLAWRNGALNLKSRKRIQDNLSNEEKVEFDRGG